MPRFESLFALLLCASCQTTPAPAAAAPAPRETQPANPPAPSSPAPPPPAATDVLAARLREPAWDASSSVKLYELGEQRIVVADFETTAKRADGMPVGFRRFALFDRKLELLSKRTVVMSQGGADRLTDERRDVDGDGHPDLLLYYSSTDQWNEPDSGWIAATQQGQLVQFRFTIGASPERGLLGEGCWASIERVPVQIVVWSLFAPDGAGGRVQKSQRVSANTVDARGLKPLRVFARSAAEAMTWDALDARVPAAQRAKVADSPEVVAECSAAPPVVVIVPHRARWALLSGLSLTAEGAGETWPSELPKPKHPHAFEIPTSDPETWQTIPDPK